MGKIAKFDISRPVVCSSRESLSADVSSVGTDLLGEDASRQLLRVGEWTRRIPSVDPRIDVVNMDELKYFHFSRVTESVGTVALDMAHARIMLDSVESGDLIGSRDLVGEINALEKKQQFSEGRGIIAKFDYIEMVDSVYKPGKKNIMLRQLPAIEKSEVASVNVLADTTRICNEAVREVNPTVYGMNEHNPSSIIGGVILGNTDVDNWQLLDRLTDSLTKNSLARPLRSR